MTSEPKDPRKRHRHDVGDVDHGPVTTELTTRAIQLVLGAAILASVGLAGYAVVLMVR